MSNRRFRILDFTRVAHTHSRSTLPSSSRPAFTTSYVTDQWAVQSCIKTSCVDCVLVPRPWARFSYVRSRARARPSTDIALRFRRTAVVAVFAVVAVVTVVVVVAVIASVVADSVFFIYCCCYQSWAWFVSCIYFVFTIGLCLSAESLPTFSVRSPCTVRSSKYSTS